MKSKYYIYLVLSIFFIAISAWYIRANIFYEKVEPDLMVLLKLKLQDNYLDKKIKKAILSEHYEEADEYYEFAKDYNYTLTTQTVQMIGEHNSITQRTLRNSASFVNGFIFGESDNSVALAGSFASDMTVVGDIRDISKEGIKLSKGEEYDELVLGLGVLGVGMSASQLFSQGLSTPAKVGTSILKVAKKSGKLSKKFIKVLKETLSKVINVKKLKNIDWKNPKKAYAMLRQFSKTINTKSIKPLFNNFSKISKNTSLADSVKLLKYVDDTKDLKKIVKVSSKFKKNTKIVLKMLGKGVLKSTRKVLQWTSQLIFGLIGLIISIISFLISTWFGIRLFRRAKNAII